MTLVAITGTPGVGKSTASKILAERHKVIDIHSYAKEHGLFEDFDKNAGSYDVDVDKLSDSLQSQRAVNGFVFMDGHLSHFVDCDSIIVLRCDPAVISQRLKERGYDDAKVLENVQAEMLDVILCESMDSGVGDVHEIDCTDMTPAEVADKIEDIIIRRNADDCLPGKVNWSSEMDRWF
jgi:adenylate kinase